MSFLHVKRIFVKDRLIVNPGVNAGRKIQEQAVISDLKGTVGGVSDLLVVAVYGGFGEHGQFHYRIPVFIDRDDITHIQKVKCRV